MADAPLVQPTAFTADGAPIAPDKVPEAIAKGEAYFERGAKVLARTANGRLVEVPAEQAGHHSLTALSPDELAGINEKRVYGKGLGNQAKAFGAGAARSLTLGGSDVVAAGLGGAETAHTLDALRRQNPLSSAAGEVAGAVAPLLVTGGGAAAAEGAVAAEEASVLARGAGAVARVAGAPLRAVGKLGSLAEHGAQALVGTGAESLAGRVAQKSISLAAGGAAEGAVFGAGSAMSDSALKGEPLTAEALAAGIGHGALFGGVLGAGIGAATEAAPALLSKALPKEGLDSLATKFARKQLGRDFENVGKGQSREVAEQWKDASANLLLERKLVSGENAGKTVLEASKKPVDIADNIGVMREEIGAEIGQTRERAAQVMQENPAIAPNTDELIAKGEAYVKSLRKRGNTGAMSQARAAERELNLLKQKIEEATAPLAPIAAPEAASAEALPANDVTVPGETAAASAAPVPVQPPDPASAYRAVTEWQRNLEKDLNPAGVAKSMRGVAVKNFGARQELSKLVSEYLKDATAQALTAAGEDGSIVAQLSRDYAGTIAMEQAARKEADRVLKNRHVSLTDHMLGIGAALTHMASGNAGALATMALGGAAAIGNKMVREQGNAWAAQIARRASRMTELVDSAAKSLSLTSERITTPVRAVSSQRESFQPASQSALREDFTRVRERLQELQDPAHQQAQLSHATGHLQTAYPEVAGALSQQLMRAQSYLTDQLPQPIGGSSPVSPLATPPVYSPRDMQRFLAKANAALDPETTIENLASGKVDDDAIDAMRVVYPSTWGALREKAITYLAANKEMVPYSRVVHVSRLFEFPGDSSMVPTRAVELQKTIQQISQAPNGSGPGAPGPTKKARPSSSKAASVGHSYGLPGSRTPGSN